MSKKELNDLRKLVEGLQREGVGKINVEQEVKKSFKEIMEVERKRKKRQKSKTGEQMKERWK